MKAKILAFGLIAILIVGAFKLKIIATEYFLKVTDAETQKQVMQDCSNLPSAISEDIKDCEEVVRNDGAKRN